MSLMRVVAEPESARGKVTVVAPNVNDVSHVREQRELIGDEWQCTRPVRGHAVMTGGHG